MERRSFVQGAGLAGVLAAGVAPAIVHAQANIRWRLTSSFPKSLDTLWGVSETFATKVKEPHAGHSRSPVEAVTASGNDSGNAGSGGNGMGGGAIATLVGTEAATASTFEPQT